MTSPFRPEYEQALKLLGGVVHKLVENGYPPPVLVGGAAVEFHTAGSIFSGDFDLTTPFQEALEEELLAAGFEKPFGAGKLTRGWVHPEMLIGIEVVGRTPFEGKSDQDRLVLVDVSGSPVTVIPVEDIIADRMGQYNSAPQMVPEMLEQAIMLYQLAWELDEAYLEKRIREETVNDLGLEDLKSKADEKDNT